MTAPPSEDAQPRVLADRFELRHVLGTGGMATVWSAYDRRLGRMVAVKQLRDHLSAEHADRIRREARAAARIDDPRVVTVLDLDHDADGHPFLVLEAHDGATLADQLRDGALPLDRALRLVDDLLGGLGAAHRCGVLHRDIKPSNLLVAGDGYRLTDFGIASLDDDTATHGDLIGTLVYLAPERFDGAPATPRTDVFAAAAVIHEALGGQQPFRGDNAAQSLERLRAGRVEPLPPHVPRALAEALRRALDPDPVRRPADADALARLIADDGSPTEAAPVLEPGTAPLPTTVVVPAPPPADPVASVTVPLDPPVAAGSVFTDRTEPVAVAGPVEQPTVTLPPPRSDDAAGATRTAPVTGHRSDQVGAAIRRPQVVLLIAAVAILLALVVAATGGGGGDPTPTGGDQPVDRLDEQLDRIVEIGR